MHQILKKTINGLEEHLEGDVQLENISEKTAQLALQGPLAETFLQKLVSDTSLVDIGPFKFQQEVDINGKKALISRTGYTGEDGFEIYCDPEDAAELMECNFRCW